jgi:hypothetical protein
MRESIIPKFLIILLLLCGVSVLSENLGISEIFARDVGYAASVVLLDLVDGDLG